MSTPIVKVIARPPPVGRPEPPMRPRQNQVAPELGDFDLDQIGGRWKDPAAQLLANLLDEHVTGVEQLWCQDQVPDVEHRHDCRKNGSQVPARFGKGPADRFLADQPGQGQGIPGVVMGIGAEATKNRGDARHGLQAPAVAAPALVAVFDDANMTDLAGGRVLTLVQRSVEDDTGSDSGSEFDQQEIAVIGGMPAELGEGRDLGIVGDGDGKVEAVTEIGWPDPHRANRGWSLRGPGRRDRRHREFRPRSREPGPRLGRSDLLISSMAASLAAMPIGF